MPCQGPGYVWAQNERVKGEKSNPAACGMPLQPTWGEVHPAQEVWGRSRELHRCTGNRERGILPRKGQKEVHTSKEIQKSWRLDTHRYHPGWKSVRKCSVSPDQVEIPIRSGFQVWISPLSPQTAKLCKTAEKNMLIPAQ